MDKFFLTKGLPSDTLDGDIGDRSFKVTIQDQFSQVVDLLASEHLGDFALDTDTALLDTTITITTDGTVPTVSMFVCLNEEDYFYQGKINTVAHVSGNQYIVTLATPLDYPFTTAGGCSLINTDLSVDGSVTPRIFRLSLGDFTLDTGTALLDATITITTDGTVPTVSMFVCLKEEDYFYQGKINTVAPVSGNQYIATLATPLDYPFTTAGGCSLINTDLSVDGIVGGLEKGIVLRAVYNGVAKNIFTARTNGDLHLHADLSPYLDATLGPDGQYALNGVRYFNGHSENGVTIRLTNIDEPDEFQLVVQDDLSSLTRGALGIQWH